MSSSSISPRHLIIIILLFLLLASTLIGSWHSSQQLHAQANEWTTAERLSPTGVDAVTPDIAIDSLGVTHIVYVETDFGDKGDIYYIHNRSGAWSTPVRLSGEGSRTEAGDGNTVVAISTVTVDGAVHLGVAYQARLRSNSQRIMYVFSVNGGVSWSVPQEASGTQGIHPALVLDDTGQPHLAYIKTSDGEKKARYTTRINTFEWTSPESFSDPNAKSDDQDRNPALAYTRGTDGQVWIHAFFQTQPASRSQAEMRVLSRRRAPDGVWQQVIEHDSNIGQYPCVISSGTTLFAVWSAKESGVDIEPFFSRSDDNGATWSTPIDVGTGQNDIGQRPAIARSPMDGVLGVVWEDDKDSGTTKYNIYHRMSADGGNTWSTAQPILRADGVSSSARIAAHPAGGFRVVWDDSMDGKLGIFTSSYNSPGAPPVDTTPTPGASPTPPPIGSDTGWLPEERLTQPNIDSVGPDIAIDSTGVAHVVYVETDFGDVGRVYYRHNRGGTWSEPREISQESRTEAGGGNRQLSISTVTINGQVIVGIAYQARLGDGSRRVFYHQSDNGGVTWSGREEASTTAGIHPFLVLDDRGTAHLAYIKSGGNELKARYTVRQDSGWSPPAEIQNDVDKNITLAYTRDSAGGQWIHLAFQTAPGFSAGQDEMRIISRHMSPSGEWSPIIDHDINIAQYPKLISDSRATLYAVWSSKQNAEVDIEPYFSRSVDHGATWLTPPIDVGLSTSNLGQRPELARSPLHGALAVVWEDDYQTEQKFKYDIFSRMSLDDGDTWGGVQPVFRGAGGSGSANIAADPVGSFRAVWDDGIDGKLRIFTSAHDGRGLPSAPAPPPTHTPTPIVPVATPTTPPPPKPRVSIQAESPIATTSLVSLTLQVDGDADEYQLSNDGQSFSAYAPIPANGRVSWQIEPASGGSNACRTYTIYARVRAQATDAVSDITTTRVQYDPAVDATVLVQNPRLANGMTNAIQNYGGGGAYGGDPNYTREDFYHLNVRANPGECSGLTSVQSGAIRLESIINSGSSVQSFVPIPGFNLKDGTHALTITVADGANHVESIQRQITLDRAAPQLAAGATMSGPESSTDGIISLTFQNVVVTDTYRRADNPAQQFWGVWMANSRDTIPLTDTQKLNTLRWYPQQVNTLSGEPPFNFTVPNWDLSLGYWDREDLRAGTHIIYARILDGAGNASQRTIMITTPITVTTDLEPGKTVYLPIIRS